MKITKTAFKDLLILEPDVHTDPRGYFFESYNERQMQKAGIEIEFVQDNQSHSVKNVIRGLHFQFTPLSQTMLIRTLYGSVLDIAVDLRKDQPTYRKVFSFVMSAENKAQILIPKRFAHGLSVLSEAAEILYKCDDYYHPECSGGIIYNDAELDIDWRISASDAIVSAKDKELPTLSALGISF